LCNFPKPSYIQKSNFYSEKKFSSRFSTAGLATQPACLDFQPSRPNRHFFLLPHRSNEPAPALCRRPMPPRLHLNMVALPQAPQYILRPLPHLPSNFRGVKHHLKSEPFHPINAGNSSAVTTCRPSLPLGHYKKGRTLSSSTAHPPSLLLLSPHLSITLTKRHRRRFFTAAALSSVRP
jgi:hypothetical protein